MDLSVLADWAGFGGCGTQQQDRDPGKRKQRGNTDARSGIEDYGVFLHGREPPLRRGAEQAGPAIDLAVLTENSVSTTEKAQYSTNL